MHPDFRRILWRLAQDEFIDSRHREESGSADYLICIDWNRPFSSQRMLAFWHCVVTQRVLNAHFIVHARGGGTISIPHQQRVLAAALLWLLKHLHFGLYPRGGVTWIKVKFKEKEWSGLGSIQRLFVYQSPVLATGLSEHTNWLAESNLFSPVAVWDLQLLICSLCRKAVLS